MAPPWKTLVRSEENLYLLYSCPPPHNRLRSRGERRGCSDQPKAGTQVWAIRADELQARPCPHSKWVAYTPPASGSGYLALISSTLAIQAL